MRKESSFDWKASPVVPPFKPELLNKMVLVKYEDLVKRYKIENYDIEELDRRMRKDLQDTIVCMPFGDRRIYYNKKSRKVMDWGLHLGTDYFLKAGNPIFSIMESKVIIAGNYFSSELENDWGNIIILKAKNGLNIFYAHLDFAPNIVKQGNRIIQKGELIGHVAKGYTKANGNWPEHLHLQISKIDMTHGYANDESAFKDYINPEDIFPIGGGVPKKTLEELL